MYRDIYIFSNSLQSGTDFGRQRESSRIDRSSCRVYEFDLAGFLMLPPIGPSRSADGYVRIPKSELATVNIHHLASAIDLSIMLPEGANALPQNTLTGITEWAGEWKGAQVSLGWDWGFISGQIVVVNGTEIRSNVLVLLEDIHVESGPLNRIYLLEWIESIAWRTTGIPELIRSSSQ